jgi:hypothetical protein
MTAVPIRLWAAGTTANAAGIMIYVKVATLRIGTRIP